MQLVVISLSICERFSRGPVFCTRCKSCHPRHLYPSDVQLSVLPMSFELSCLFYRLFPCLSCVIHLHFQRSGPSLDAVVITSETCIYLCNQSFVAKGLGLLSMCGQFSRDSVSSCMRCEPSASSTSFQLSCFSDSFSFRGSQSHSIRS